ncbi:rms7 (mitochondrion) [Auxenochlorella protothecoides x Auxenochlorella symbiontica]
MNGQKQYGTTRNTVINSNKFINLLMIDGKKSVAVQLFYDSLLILKHKKLKKNVFSDQTPKDTVKMDKIHMNHNQRIGKGKINEVLEKGKINYIYEFNKKALEEITIPLNNDSISIEMSSLLEVVSIAIENVTPSVELKKVRRAGNTFLIPAILSQHKADTLAMRWIIESARKKQQGSSQNFSECLADEIYQAYSKQGKARQKRDELHTAAITNRANIRYRWW